MSFRPSPSDSGAIDGLDVDGDVRHRRDHRPRLRIETAVTVEEGPGSVMVAVALDPDELGDERLQPRFELVVIDAEAPCPRVPGKAAVLLQETILHRGAAPVRIAGAEAQMAEDVAEI